jgi:hypothetical protein
MKNIDAITTQLVSSKAFVDKYARDTNPQTVEEIQGLLSQAIESAKDDDVEGLIQTLDEINSQQVNGWDLTSLVRSLL